MFLEARLKLTVWYVLIIMIISLIFSGAIYSVITRELGRGFRQAEMRFYEERFGFLLPPPERIHATLIEELKTAKKRVIFRLLLANGIILVISAGSGYFLAGKTLKPIESALEEQKRFVDDASHELRTPLTALKTSIEVALRDKKLNLKEARLILSGNLADVDGLVTLTGNLLSLTQNQTNHRHFESVPIGQLIKKAIRKITPLAKQKKITINLMPGNQKINGHAISLEEMMLIFLDNAVKYTPKGGKVMVVTSTERKHLIVKIEDTGVGIPAKDIPHIFDRFYRVDRSRSNENAAGFGLGLSLAKKIIDLHHGSVEAVSKINKGTIFNIKLPLYRA